MFKILSLLISFIRESIFDTKEEQNFVSHEFNIRKFFVFTVIIILFTANIFLVRKVMSLAEAYVDHVKVDKELATLCGIPNIEEKYKDQIVDNGKKKELEKTNSNQESNDKDVTKSKP